MDRKAMYKLSYGLFVLTAREDEKDNGCIINKMCIRDRLYAALGEAAFLMGIEKNQDIVTLASYAPVSYTHLHHVPASGSQVPAYQSF